MVKCFFFFKFKAISLFHINNDFELFIYLINPAMIFSRSEGNREEDNNNDDLVLEIHGLIGSYYVEAKVISVCHHRNTILIHKENIQINEQQQCT